MEKGGSNKNDTFREVLTSKSEEQTSYGSPPEEGNSIRPDLQVLHLGHVFGFSGRRQLTCKGELPF